MKTILPHLIKVKLSIWKIDSEFQLTWVQDGTLIDKYTYFTDDYQDALDTMKAIKDAYNATKQTNVIFI